MPTTAGIALLYLLAYLYYLLKRFPMALREVFCNLMRVPYLALKKLIGERLFTQTNINMLTKALAV
jgi:hypothetical protein